MTLTLAEIARFTGSASVLPDLPVSKWSIDTKKVEPGTVFFALPGTKRDGHEFLPDAEARGAAAAVVDGRDLPEFGALRLIRVAEPLAALQDLARRARGRLSFPMIAVTGSAGKTTTKETIAALAAAARRVTRNEGNLNNHIGLPLSILNMEETAEAGVVEMGMNHAGEIRFLCGIARPDIGVVTNVGTAHIENFESIEGIALAKRELIESLGPEGVAVLNADDARVRAFAEIHPGRAVTFGIEAGADFRAEEVSLRPDGSSFTIQGVRFETPLRGRHGVLNVTAGVAAGSILEIPMAAMAEAAASLREGAMRGERITHKGVTILNDCYNSNPEAAKAMLDALAAEQASRRVAVLGEMLELGDFAERLHAEVGAHAAARGIQLVIGVRGAARSLAEAAARGGAESLFFNDAAEAGEALRSLARPGDVVLCKGSRGTQVEKAVERFMAP